MSTAISEYRVVGRAPGPFRDLETEPMSRAAAERKVADMKLERHFSDVRLQERTVTPWEDVPDV